MPRIFTQVGETKKSVQYSILRYENDKEHNTF